MEEYDFNYMDDAHEWARRQSLVFDTDEECQSEADRLLRSVKIRERDGDPTERE